MKQLVILAGGEGTRLKSHLGDVPKALAPLAGKPVVEHQIELAHASGFGDIRLLTFHGSTQLEEALGDGRRWGVEIRHHVETAARGTAGAVLEHLSELADRFVVLYGDVFLRADLDALWRFHLDRRPLATLFVHPNDHPHDSDLVEVDPDGAIVGFHPYPHAEDGNLRNLVNAALYVVEKRGLEPWVGEARKLDFGRDLFPAMVERGLALAAFQSRDYVKDVGTPERLARVERDLASGRVDRMLSSRPCPAVFLDRDGTLNREVDRVSRLGQLELLPGVERAVRDLNHQGILAVVVTNQPVVARGDCTEADLERIHAKLEMLLGMRGAYLDGIYYCPHHPDSGFAGERPELKFRCDCRKPGFGLIERAIDELVIDRDSSFMVGDSTVDMQTARNAGLEAILVRTGHAGNDGRHGVVPDAEFDDLNEAVRFIIQRVGCSPAKLQVDEMTP